MASKTVPLVPGHPSRRVVSLGLLLAPSTVGARPAPCAAPTVLFVCPAGTVKSAIARETLKARAARAGVAVRVQSRGLHVENHVSPALAANLRADGLDPAAEPARPFQDTDVSQADIVIAFDEAAQVPALRRARAWDIPSWNDHYDAAKAALSAHVDALIDELRVRAGRACGNGPP
jgi:protein-tyrosine-phosphatase